MRQKDKKDEQQEHRAQLTLGNFPGGFLAVLVRQAVRLVVLVQLLQSQVQKRQGAQVSHQQVRGLGPPAQLVHLDPADELGAVGLCDRKSTLPVTSKCARQRERKYRNPQPSPEKET